MGAVKNAVQRDELDPAIMEFDPNKPLSLQMGCSENDIGTSMADVSARKISVEEGSSQPLAKNDHSDAKNALNAMFANCEGQNITEKADELVEAEEDEEPANPRAALMAMLSKRAAPIPADEPQSPPSDAVSQAIDDSAVEQREEAVEGVEKAEDLDQRTALMTMLSKRAPPVTADEPNAASDGATDRDNAKDSLNAMFVKRSGASEENVVKVSDEPAEEDENEGTTADPRAALMPMLATRAPPIPADEPQSTTPDGTSDRDSAKDALNAMFAERNGSVEDVDAKLAEEGSVKKEIANPHAALMSMLASRAPPIPADELQSTTPDETSDRDNAKNALNSMFAQRSGIEAVNRENPLDASAEKKKDEKPADPRVALMSMLANRAPPTAADVTLDPPSEEPSDCSDAKNALNAMFATRNGHQAPVEERKEEEEQPDPRAALMSMLANRALPVAADEQKAEQSVENKEEEQPDPRAALMSMITKRAPPTQSDEPKSDSSPEGKEREQPDPRAALMSMITKRAPPTSEQPKSSPAEEEAPTQTDPKAAIMAAISSRAPRSQEDVPTGEPKPDDPRAAMLSMLKKRAPPTESEEAKVDTVSGPTNVGVPAGSSGDSAQPISKSADAASTNDGVPTLREDPRYAKYFKMLQMVSLFLIASFNYIPLP